MVLIYSSEVRFDICDDNLLVSGAHIYNKFLDLRIGLAFNSISFDLWHVNLRYALSGVLEHRTKCLFPPTLGLKQTVLQRLPLNFRNPRCRWTQLDLTSTQVGVSPALDFLELLQIGYDKTYIQTAWIMSHSLDNYFNTAPKVMYAILRLQNISNNPVTTDFYVLGILQRVYGIDTVALQTQVQSM